MKTTHQDQDQAHTLRSIVPLHVSAKEKNVLWLYKKSDNMKQTIQSMLDENEYQHINIVSVEIESFLKNRQIIDYFDVCVGLFNEDSETVMDLYGCLKWISNAYPLKKVGFMGYGYENIEISELWFLKIKHVWSQYVNKNLSYFGCFSYAKNSIKWQEFGKN